MTTLLYEVEPGDPSTFALVALVLAVVALLPVTFPRAARLVWIQLLHCGTNEFLSLLVSVSL